MTRDGHIVIIQAILPCYYQAIYRTLSKGMLTGNYGVQCRLIFVLYIVRAYGPGYWLFQALATILPSFELYRRSKYVLTKSRSSNFIIQTDVTKAAIASRILQQRQGGVSTAIARLSGIQEATHGSQNNPTPEKWESKASKTLG